MKNLLLVGGNFDGNCAPSGYIKKLANEITDTHQFNMSYCNGGTIEILHKYLEMVSLFDVVMWFANVPNSYEKNVSQIKKINPKAILVTSKNNLENKYSYQEIIARMLVIKSNLALIFTKHSDLFEATILDPLGNVYAMKATSIPFSTYCLCHRVLYLLSITRKWSRQVFEAREIPNEEKFFEIAKAHAAKFHDLIHAGNTERFLGNLSFRCERGFPSFKNGNVIYVSKRNIDKREVGRDGFVAVDEAYTEDGAVGYHGEVKPSVDAPVQVALYKAYPHIKYMMHSHVYIKGAPFTKEKVPCGAMEEVGSIQEVLTNRKTTHATVNLLGHGSLVMVENLNDLETTEYYERKIPEL